MTKRAPEASDAEKRRVVRAAIRDPAAARFRAGEKKAGRQVELSRRRRVKAQDLPDTVTGRHPSPTRWRPSGRNLSGTAGYYRPVSKITRSLGRALAFAGDTPGRRKEA